MPKKLKPRPIAGLSISYAQIIPLKKYFELIIRLGIDVQHHHF